MTRNLLFADVVAIAIAMAMAMIGIYCISQ